MAIIDPTRVKLGKRPPRVDMRTLLMHRYLLPSIPPPPPRVDWSRGFNLDWGMMGNDTLGDCTEAAKGHALQTLSLDNGHMVTVPDSVVIGAYESECGYDPSQTRPDGTNSTDQGGVELEVLNDWRQTGFGGHKLLAYVATSPGDAQHVQQAIAIFGGVYIGIQLPLTAQGEPEWDLAPDDGSGDAAPGSWGGHAVWCPAYDSFGVTCITWGQRLRMSWAFWATYCVAPETRILTDDLRWVPAEDFEAGDGLLAFDEEACTPRLSLGRCRLWRRGRVSSTRMIQQPCYDLEFEDGTEVRCSADHKWLSCHGGGAHWLTTSGLVARNGQASNIVKPLEVWDTETSREAGYLAAAFDGEGCLTQRDLSNDRKGLVNSRLCFSQKQNAMYDEVRRCLALYSFDAGEEFVKKGSSVKVIHISKRKEVLRFLGAIRPFRLLAKFNPDMLGQMSMRTVKLVSKTFVGEQPVVAITSDTGTFMAEGLASHNCDESYTLISQDWLNSSNFSPSKVALADLMSDLAAVTN